MGQEQVWSLAAVTFCTSKPQLRLCLLLILLTAACNTASDPVVPDKNGADDAPTPKLPTMFEDVTDAVGIDFVHQPKEHEQQYFMPRIVGSGGAFLDFDNDGRIDLYLVQNGGTESGLTNRLYQQTADGKFHDVTEGSGLGISGRGMGVAIGDVNNDGRTDVLLNEFGASRLLLNETAEVGTPKFRDVTEAAGIDNQLWGTSTCFVDFDRDGWLDFVLVNYVNYDPSRWCADGGGRQDYCGPDAFNGRVAKLYRNLGAAGDGESVKFEDVTVSSGLSKNPGPGLGIYCADFDGDGWPDIFIANDGKPNHLWMNQKDGTFKEEAITRGVGYNSMGKSEADMGIAIGDVDGNGLFDIFVTHLSDETHTLWSQDPVGIFIDRTATTGLTAANWRGTGFGTVMADIDNDGDQDLLIANGRVTRETGPLPETSESLDPFWRDYAQRNQILLNDGTGRFTDASLANDAMCGRGNVSRGLACADFDNDGALDLLITHVAEPPSLLRNIGAKGHWLMVRARDAKLKRDVYGAQVVVIAGEKRWQRQVNPGYSYLCSNDHRVHFGLGELTEVDAIDVIWPDGQVERFAGGSVDRLVELTRGEGQIQ